MKKLIAFVLVAVMLIAMSASVLASEHVEATPCASNANPCDGKINPGEWGNYVTHITSEFAYDTDSEDEMDGCNAFVYYLSVDPYVIDAYIYISWSKSAADRLYFCVDVSLRDGKCTGYFNGNVGEDHWSDDSIQYRASADVEWTDDPTVSDLWGSKTMNIIIAAYTKNMQGGVLPDGAVLYGNTGDGSNNGGLVSACDHCVDRMDLWNSGMFDASIGHWGNRLHVESILKTAYFASGTALEHVDIGDSFACSFAVFNATTDLWCTMLCWGHGISGLSTGLGKTGSNEVVIADAPAGSVTTGDIGGGADTGDALVVVVATAIMAIGTAVIVKKVK